MARALTVNLLRGSGNGVKHYCSAATDAAGDHNDWDGDYDYRYDDDDNGRF